MDKTNGVNPLLAPENQGREYIVKAFTLRPEITLLTSDGKEEKRYLFGELAVHEADLDLTFRGFMDKLGLKMDKRNGS